MKIKINPALGNNPLTLLFTMVVPQAILIFSRVLTLLRIRQQIASEELWVVYSNYIIIPILLLLAGLMSVLRAKRNQKDSWQFLTGLFLLHAASLVCFLLCMGRGIFPSAVDRWILPEGPFVMLQLATAMPALFYSLLCLANIRFAQRIRVDVLTSFITLALIPAGFYFLTISSIKWKLSETVIIGVFVFGTVIAAFAFLQLLLWLSVRMKREWISILVFGLIFPLGGLALNYTVPFPAPLQHWGFYALTVLNAAILLWGCRAAAEKTLLSGLATAASYSFTCYFFFLFLPFLPFSLLAMIVAGAGFLVLTPTVLFIIHTRRLLIQGRELSCRFGKRRIILSFIAAFLMIPGLYAGRALIHRQMFRQVLDQVYTPDLKADVRMPSPRTSRYVLKRMIQMKDGVYVPILSECYNRIVFDGMVLPDGKIKELSTLLLGEAPEAVSSDRDWAFYSIFTDESRRRSGRNVRKPPQNVTLAEVECSHVSEAGLTEASVVLTLANDDSRQAEYTTDITIPDGIFVSGYELEIGGKMVPGLISDRKAALWVYHMIRDDARRDPGLLVYTGPGTLRLSVFPFEPNQRRQCRIRFLYPEGAAPRILIGKRPVQLSSEKTVEACMIAGEDSQALYISPQAALTYPSAVRTQEPVLLTGDSQTPGFCPEWQVKKELLRYFQSGEKQLHAVPVFITRTGKLTVEFDGAAYWMPLIPDGGWLKSPDEKIPAALPVLLFRSGEQIKALPAEKGGLLIFDGTEPIELFIPAQDKFAPLSATWKIDAESRYARAVRLMRQWRRTQTDPVTKELLRQELLRSGRALNILIPDTAFIAVENTAQQQALKDAERKSLSSHTALEFDEFNEVDSPEPGTIIMVVLSLPWLLWMQKESVPLRSLNREEFPEEAYDKSHISDLCLGHYYAYPVG